MTDTLFDCQTPGPNTPPVFYAGGKRWVLSGVRPLIGRPDRLVSPFLGAGAIEIDASCRNIPVLAGDLNEDLINFWQQLLIDSKAIAREAEKFGLKQKKKALRTCITN